MFIDDHNTEPRQERQWIHGNKLIRKSTNRQDLLCAAKTKQEEISRDVNFSSDVLKKLSTKAVKNTETGLFLST